MSLLNRTSLSVAALVLLAGAATVTAGPLNPPPGPVGPTMKPLTDVEPRIAVNAANTPGDNDATPSLFKITQPGSYYLTGNMSGVAGKNVIEISSSNVSLDLSGFLVTGGTNGILLTSSASYLYNVSVRNGQIAGCSAAGLDAGWGTGASVDHLAVQHCALAGIKVAADARVSDCVSNYNGYGVYAASNALIRACQTSRNTYAGIYAGDGTTIESCITSYNGGRGIDAYSEVLARACRISHNGTQGFDGNTNCTLDGCTISANQSEGVHAFAHLVVRGCSIDSNFEYGISCAGAACEITGNSLYGNGTGIYSTDNRGRIESNHLVSNGVNAIVITGVDNFVIRNVASGHVGLPYQVSVGNECAAIVTNPGINFSTTNSVVNLAN